jgi:hypothetical protein
MKWFLCLLACSACFADDSKKLADLLSRGGVVVIPPGDYRLTGEQSIPLRSGTKVIADGARFLLPESLAAMPHRVFFTGENVSDFSWHGGEFVGYVFDPQQEVNRWEPHANTRVIELTTTREGGTKDVLFRDVKARDIAGAVIGVHGKYEKKSASAVEHFAEHVVLENCTLLRSGKFMWDYGYLWQIMTYPEVYQPWEVERARQYFRTDLMREVKFTTDSENVQLDNASKPLAISDTAEPSGALSFMGENLPREIVRGQQYFIVQSEATFIQVAERPGGPAIRFGREGSGHLAYNLSATYLSAYAPTGSGPGKGAFDIVGARNVRVTGCTLSALGDTMHIQRCENIIFANNHITGSRMGAFFLAEYCRNATITGNLVDGTNGSRVVSVERSCTDVTMTGNTFRNGGRGVWINQPVNFVMTDNVFVNNTTKNEPDVRRGRVAYQTGQPVRFPELYFTLYDPAASYGPVIVRNNLFQVGDFAPDDAVTFAPNGKGIVFAGNTFTGRPVRVALDPTCTGINFSDNEGTEVESVSVEYDHGRR